MDEWAGFEYEGTSGERCDVAATLWLRNHPEFAGISRARVQALIEEEGLTVDSRLVPRAQKNLRPGMRVELNLTILRRLLNPPAPEHIEPVDMPLNFLHVDDDIVVVEKPAGISVHPSVTEEGPTLTAALLHHFGKLSDEGGADRPGIVHRLDKETSGLLVVARNNPAHVSLSRQFAERLTEKEYCALVIDAPERATGAVSLPIERHPHHRQKMWTGGRGREAHTEFRIAEPWGPFTLLDVAIHTGRTHQIRVHLLSEGCVILNDDKYGSGRNGSLRKFLKGGGDMNARKQWRQAFSDDETRRRLFELITGYEGIFLHARRLALTHPVSGQPMEFVCPLPQVWDEVRDVCVDG